MLHNNNEKPASKGTDTGLDIGVANEVSTEVIKKEISLSNPLDFLRCYSPVGPWCLTTYSPNVRGGGFLPSSAKDAAAFIQRWDGKQNLYFLLGIPNGKPNKQVDKESMLGSMWLWVDLDPRDGKGLPAG